MTSPMGLVDAALYKRWETAPAPEGIDPDLWADALTTRVSRAHPWDAEALDRLPHYMSGLAREKAAPEEAPREASADRQAA